MSRTKVPSSFFVYVVVEHHGHVLLIREAKHGQRWYAPAGGVEPFETLREAAERETWEEAGVRIEPLELIRIDESWADGPSAWMRFVMTARIVGDPTPKRDPDHHSLEARWVKPEQVSSFPLRHPEVIDIFRLPRRGMPIASP